MCSPSAVRTIDAEAGEVDGVAGMNDAAGLAFDGLEIGGVVVAGDVGVFAIFAVVEELADGYALDQLGHTADVIGMEMSHEEVIDPVMPASRMAACTRPASRPLLPGQPVSTRSDAPEGATSSVDWPPSTSME